MASEHEEGDHEHDDAEHGGAGFVVVFQFFHDEVGGDFGFAGDIGGDEDHGAILADGAGEKGSAGEEKPVIRAGRSAGRTTRREGLTVARAPEGWRRLLRLQDRGLQGRVEGCGRRRGRR